MADVTGPIGTLPGSRHRLPEGATCDDCGKSAEIRVQGETDSFGSEMADLCRSCWEATKAEDTSGHCDWCKKRAEVLMPRRDVDEGSCGPVYYVCAACRKRDDEALEREAALYDNESFLAGGHGWDSDEYGLVG